MGKAGHMLQPPITELFGWAAMWSAIINNILFGAKLPVKWQQEAYLKDSNKRWRKGKRQSSKGEKRKLIEEYTTVKK